MTLTNHFLENKENDKNWEIMEEFQNIALLLNDPKSPNDHQCQKEEKVNWAGAIKSSHTRQCLGYSPAIR